MDCCDCTYTTDTSVAQYPDATAVTYPEATDVVLDFPALDDGTATTLPTDSAASWGVSTTPVTTTPAPALVDPFVQSMATDMYIDVMNQIDIPMMNLTSPYGPDYTATYDSTTNSTGWVKDGDLTPSTPTTYDD
jgi:hypothetical protein